MRSGTKSAVSILLACIFLWLGIKFLLPLCFPFLLGGALALGAEPLVQLLCTRLRLIRGLASGIGVTVVFVALTVLMLVVLAVLVRELSLLAGVLPDLTDTARSGIALLQNRLLDLAGRTPQSIRPVLEQNVGALFSGGTALLDKAFSYVLGMAGTLLTHVPDSALMLGTAVISGFMISAKLPRIRKWIRCRFSGERLKPLLEVWKHLRHAVGGWVLAQLRLTCVTFLLLLSGLVLLQIPYAPLWAGSICLLDALPVLGTGTVLLPWGLILYLQGDKARAAGILGVYVVIVLIRSVLEPRLVGKQLGLDSLVTLFALYAGYKLWGIGGMILSPMLAVMVVQLLPENRKSQ